MSSHQASRNRTPTRPFEGARDRDRRHVGTHATPRRDRGDAGDASLGGATRRRSTRRGDRRGDRRRRGSKRGHRIAGERRSRSGRGTGAGARRGLVVLDGLRSAGRRCSTVLDGRIAGASIERRRVPHRLDRSPTDRARRSTGCDRAIPTLDQTRPTPTPAPAPPPWGDPGGPISLQIPVFFGFFVGCVVTVLGWVGVWGFCSRLRCAQLGWRPRFARLPSGHPGRFGDLSAGVWCVALIT